MALYCKNKLPADDVQGRSIHVSMRLNGEHKELVPFDSEDHQGLRTRLLSLLLKLLTNQELVEKVQAKMAKAADPEILGFDGRPKDIARSLMFPALMFNEGADLIEAIKQSSMRLSDESKDAFEAQVQYALQDVWSTPNSKIYVLPIRNITSIQFKAPTSTVGYIQFAYPGSIESKGGAYDAVGDENTVIFSKPSLADFEKIKAEIEKMMEAAHGGSGQKHSELDEIEKLGNLRDKGYITEAEYNLKKRQLLGLEA